MNRKDVSSQILAILGELLTWLPILITLVLPLTLMLRSDHLQVDYLMPAELFPSALVGGALLLWAALRAHKYVRWIAWAYGVMVGMLVGGQGLALVTGLASGAASPTGWRVGLVGASLVVYVLALIALGVGGILLTRDLYRKPVEAPQV